jgi:hypothetical protein
MSGHSVSKINGIGPVTQRLLESNGVHTVKDLSVIKEIEYEPFRIKNIKTFITRALKYIKDRECVEPELPPPKKVVVSITGQKTQVQHVIEEVIEKSESEGTHDDSDKEDQILLKDATRTLLQEHSWWEKKILIPCDGKDGDYTLREAIVYELTIEAFNRVSFICSWVIEEYKHDRTEKICTMTFSPTLILYFNRQRLPELVISIDENQWSKLKNKHTIENVLWEAKVLHYFSGENHPYHLLC